MTEASVRYEGASRPQLAPAELAALSRIRPSRTVCSVAVAWGLLLIPAVAAIVSGNWLVYGVAAVWIGFRQVALFNLLHDGVHGLLLPRRVWNDLLSDLFAAMPLGTTTRRYRIEHLAHHKHLGSANDPDLQMVLRRQGDRLWPATRSAAYRQLLQDACGLSFIRNLLVPQRRSLFALIGKQPMSSVLPQRRSKRDRITLREAGLFATLAVVGIASLLELGLLGSFLLLWVLPLATTFQVGMRLRQWGDHLGLPPSAEMEGTRDIQVGIVDRLLIAANNANYHLSHHLFPQVPHYNLAELHRALMCDPVFAARVPSARGYLLGQGSVVAALADAPEELRRRTLTLARSGVDRRPICQ